MYTLSKINDDIATLHRLQKVLTGKKEHYAVAVLVNGLKQHKDILYASNDPYIQENPSGTSKTNSSSL